MKKAALLSAVLSAISIRASAVDFSLEYLSVPAVYQFVQSDLAKGTSGQESKDLPMPTFGLRVSQSLPELFSGWPLSFGFETGFGLPAGTRAFDERLRKLNSSALLYNDRFEGDSTEFSMLCVPILATIGYVPKTSGISIGGQAGIGVVLMDVLWDEIDSVYTGPLNDPSYVTTTHNRLFNSSLAVQFAGGLVVPVTETLSARLWGGAMWIAQSDNTQIVRKESGTTTVEGLQIGGVGYLVRIGLSSSL